MLLTPPRALALLAAVAAVSVASCRSTKTLTGRVVDYDTHQPIAGARIRLAQTGWGWGRGGLTWDKDYSSTVAADDKGHFTARYEAGDSANVVATADGYSDWRYGYPANGDATILLRKRPETPSLRREQMAIGVYDDGSRFGWSFASRATVKDASAADVFPAEFDPDALTLELVVGLHGGIRFLGRRDLRVAGDYLVFAPPAPDDGYAPRATIDLSQPDGKTDGIYFVRTADGEHFAKFEVGPAVTSGSGDGIRRQVFFAYVYDPNGGRTLPYAVGKD